MGQILSQSIVRFVPGHLSLLYHVSRVPELTSPGPMLSSAITRFTINKIKYLKELKNKQKNKVLNVRYLKRV